jgi:tRNA threonylcarbamoyladenosine biosynthesis protein TsaE
MTERHEAATIDEFEAFAVQVARRLRAGDVVALEGPLGSGKTAFVAAAVRGLGNEAEVASPTFTFWHRYGGRPPIEHLDFYRIDDPADAEELGLEEAFDAERIVFVEWASRMPDLVPPGATVVRISGAGNGPRSIEIEPPGPQSRKAG